MLAKDEDKMTSTRNFAVNSFLKELILDNALKVRDKETFLRMTGDKWEYYLEKFYIKNRQDSQDTNHIGDDITNNLFLYNEFFEDFNEDSLDLEDYMEDTTFTDIFSEKKKVLYQLMILTRTTNERAFNVLNTIYNDNELIHLLTIISDKTYRNGVFYMDDEDGALKIKDSRLNVDSNSYEELLEVYRKTQDTFFIEIKFIKAKNAGLV